jgi:hypothetical protein
VADIAKLSVGREEYYTRELATDHEAYLSGHGESPGRWYGAGASSLNLQGEASVAEFQAIFEGRHPATGELLGRPHGRNAVPAFDVVLRPTKSVSVLYGLGDPATGRAVLAAHHAGVAEATAYLDDHLGARRGHGGHQRGQGSAPTRHNGRCRAGVADAASLGVRGRPSLRPRSRVVTPWPARGHRRCSAVLGRFRVESRAGGMGSSVMASACRGRCTESVESLQRGRQGAMAGSA